MISCLIVDDSPIAREELLNILQNISDIQVLATCENVMQAEQILSENNIEVIFLDIDMPNISGIEWVKTIPVKPLIVFVTSHPEYALEGFELNATDYLVKPIQTVRLLQCIHKIRDILSYKQKYKNQSIEPEQDYFFIKSERDYIKIMYNDLVYLEAVGDFTSFYLVDEIKHFGLVPLKQLQIHLPNNTFMRVHKSYIVNLSHIDIVGTYEIKAKGYTIPLNKDAREELYQKLIAHKIIKRKN